VSDFVRMNGYLISPCLCNDIYCRFCVASRSTGLSVLTKPPSVSRPALWDLRNRPRTMAKEVKAKYEYHSGHEDDLSFAAGQLITVTEEVDDEWYNGQYTDSQGTLHQGMFPRNFVTVAPKPSPAPPHPPPPSAAKQDAGKDVTSKSKPAGPQLGSPGTTKKQVLPTASRDAAAKSASPPPPPAANLKNESRTPVREAEPHRQRVSSPIVVFMTVLTLDA
jgi:hypothetical protein